MKKKLMKILITGGTGYIASHTSLSLLDLGHDVILFDNLSNSSVDTVGNIKNISNKDVSFILGDLSDTKLLSKTICENKIEMVIHFAALKAVGESVADPIKYFQNNISGSLSLFEAMKENNVKNLVFSSSATVYGEPKYLPIDENHPLAAINPYGRSKLHIEEILKDLAFSDKSWKIICLRYFNPVGAHESGLIGENPNGIPNNLFPLINNVLCGKLDKLSIFGKDYNTADGTAIRDYIHVMDIADGHSAALNLLSTTDKSFEMFNLGTGKGSSVLEIVNAYEKECVKKVNFEFVDRRPGDAEQCYADVSKATRYLKWAAKRNLQEMCSSAIAYNNLNKS